MLSFFEAIINFGFMQNALFAGILASILCGVTGTFVVVKRISYIAGGIAHSALGGVGVAYYFGLNPLWGAFIAAVLSAMIIGIIKLRSNQHIDTVISALWSIGMATGIIFMSLKPGYNSDLMVYLFGNILLVDKGNLVILSFLNIAVLITVVVFYRQLISISFDKEFSRIRGLKVDVLYLLLLLLIAVTVVVLLQVVGLILLIALLTLPAAIAGLFSKSFGRVMVLAVVFGGVFTMAGIYFSFSWNLPSGATIIVIAGIFYLISLLGVNIGRHQQQKSSND